MPEIKNKYYKSFSSFRNKISKLNNFSIMQINIRGINDYPKFEKFKLMLSSLKYKFDVIVLGETKLKKTFPKSIYNLKGYDMYVSCRTSSKNSKGKLIGGGGLIIYVKKEITITKHETHSSTFEKISFDINHNEQRLKLITYYRPPESQKLKNIKEFMNDVETEISDDNERIMLIGDINIDISENCRNARDYNNLITGYDMKLLNNQVTRDVSGKIIDHVSVNFSDSCNFSVHTISLDKNFTDHNMIVTTIEDMCLIKKESEIKTYDFVDYEKLVNIIHESQEINDILNCTDVNVIAQRLTKSTYDAIQSCTKTFKIKTNNNLKLIPWLNKRIKKIQNKKNKIRKKMKKNDTCLNTKKQYKDISLKLKKAIKTEEKKFCFKNLMVKDPKQLWRNLNSILGRSSNDRITSVSDRSGKLIVNKGELAENFNHYFIDSIEETVSSMPESRKSFQFSSIQKSMGLDNTDEVEVINAINSLKNVSPGIDGIKPKILKILKYELARPLCHLINLMFESGIYPDMYKTAIVVPINKSGKKNDIKDYRPVSILTSFNKVIEKILYRRIMSFISANNLIFNRQYGFREGSNTETAAVELINDIRQKLDQKKKVSLIMLDVSKAFDSVNTQQLLSSLERSGIRGKVLSLIKSYLTNRKQVVKVGNHISQAQKIKHGVVQGGTLGSLLFLIFINEISQLSINGTLYLYADDALVLNAHDKNEKIDNVVKNDVSKIVEFLNSKRLAINENKTTYMIIHSPYQKISDNDEIVINDRFIMKRSRTAKYLGLVLDENLKFDEHCKILESKLTSSAAMLWKMRKKLPVYIKKKVYHTLFESHLLYMNIIWGTACDNVLKPLQTIQNRALRSVFNLDSKSSRVDMYLNHTENCLPIRGLNFLLTSSYIFRNLHAKVHSNIRFTYVTTRRGRSSQRRNLQSTQSNTHYGHKSITSFGVNIFNSLHTDLKNCRHPAAFKWALRCDIRNKSFISACFSNEYLKRYC